MIELPRSVNYGVNQDRYPCRGNQYECIVCGKPVNVPAKSIVRVHDGGSAVVTNEEAETLDANADLGMHPVGQDCLRRHPELKPYIEDRSNTDGRH